MNLLYHGTSVVYEKKIMTKGLLPRGKRDAVWTSEGFPDSHRDMVYLTNEINSARFMAERTSYIRAKANPKHNHLKNVLLVVGIRRKLLSVDNLYPDEMMYVYQKMKDDLDLIPYHDIVAARRTLKRRKDDWQRSLEITGTVAHRGVILPDQFVFVKKYRRDIHTVRYNEVDE